VKENNPATMSELALERIREAKKYGAIKLDLQHCGLECLPEELFELRWLKELDLGNPFSSMVTQDHPNNTLPENELEKLGRLKKLTWLNLRENGIKETGWLKSLSGLEHLSLKSNHISVFEGMENLSSLRELFLEENHIQKINNSHTLISLETLSLSSNNSNTIEGLHSLKNLKTLSLSFSLLTDIPNLDQFPSLENLDMCGANLSKITGLKNCKQLKEIQLWSNNIEEIDDLFTLPNLTFVDLSNNNITSQQRIAALVAHLPDDAKLILFQNPIKNIPTTLLGPNDEFNCLPSLKGYFQSLKKKMMSNAEVKLVLLGNSTAGKTSLYRFLKEEQFDEQQTSTHGIACDNWKITAKDIEGIENGEKIKDIHINTWDFGGQEYYHGTHRFFLTDNTVYLLLWTKGNNLQGWQDTEISFMETDGTIKTTLRPLEHFPYQYWLDTIRFYTRSAGQTSILMLQNKTDIEPIEPVKDAVVEQYQPVCLTGSVKKAFENKTKCILNPDFLKLKTTLFNTVEKHLSHVWLSENWILIKQQMDQWKEDYLPFTEFAARCRKTDPSMSELELGALITHYHNSGRIFYYADNAVLSQTVFINPQWITNNIYRVLDSEVLQNKGIFTKADVIKKSGAVEAGYLLSLMLRFELIFTDAETGDYIAPQYLPDTCSNHIALIPYTKKKDKTGYSFAIHFPLFMPRGIMLRFLAKYGPDAAGQLYWRKGIAFIHDSMMALVACEEEQRIIHVFVENNSPTAQRWLFDTLFELSDRNENIQICTDGAHFVSICRLKEQIAARNEHISSEQGKLLKLQQFYHFFDTGAFMPGKNNDMQKVKLFISYAREDQPYREQLDKHLSTMKRNGAIEVWHDEFIGAGKEWDQEIKQALHDTNIIVLLISSDFLASNYINNVEVKQAIEKYEKGEVKIVPVIVRSCHWQRDPVISKFQALPRPADPVKSWDDADEAWTNVVEALGDLVESMKAAND
jgi:internalin A